MNTEHTPRPISSGGIKNTVGMVIYFYCVFYVIMKVVYAFQTESRIPYLLLSIPFVILGYWGFRQKKTRQFSWVYNILGIVFISAIRYYEQELILYLSEVVS